MLQIAICDDQPEELAALCGLVDEYLGQAALPAQVCPFPHPDALLSACQTRRFSIYLLDIVMPMMSGVELGTAIRRQDRDAQIIFATTAPEYALASFASSPLNYLVKPVERKALFDTLDLAFSRVRPDDVKTVTVKTKDGTRVIPLSSIVLCEYVNHAVVYRLLDGETMTSVSSKTPFFETAKPLLEDGRFIQPHTSFIVNMSCVQTIGKQGFSMRGGAEAPIAQKHYKEIHKTFLDYLFAEEKT